MCNCAVNWCDKLRFLHLLLDSLLCCKAVRSDILTIAWLLVDIQSDSHLFRSIAYTDHCLHYLLPEKLNRSMNRRHRVHDYTLNHISTMIEHGFTSAPTQYRLYGRRFLHHISTTQLKNTFVNRCLFSIV